MMLFSFVLACREQVPEPAGDSNLPPDTSAPTVDSRPVPDTGTDDSPSANTDSATGAESTPDSVPDLESPPDDSVGSDSGDDSGDTAPPPEPEWAAVAAAIAHTCGLRLDGTVACWGNNDYGQTDAPPDSFIAIAAQNWASCGIKAGGEVVCWGGSETFASPPVGPWVAISCWEYCAVLSATGEVAWWGYGSEDLGAPPAGPFIAMASGSQSTCMLRGTGELFCRNQDGTDEQPLSGTYEQLSIASSLGAAVDNTGMVSVWGESSHGVDFVPRSPFAQISIGQWFGCGVLTTGAADCWGTSWYYWGSETTVPPSGVNFTQIAVGEQHACGVTTGGQIECWGYDNYGQSTPP